MLNRSIHQSIYLILACLSPFALLTQSLKAEPRLNCPLDWSPLQINSNQADFRANNIQFNNKDSRFQLTGNSRIEYSGLRLFGEKFSMNTSKDTLKTDSPLYVEGPKQRLWSKSLQGTPSDIELTSAIYSPCMGASPNDTDWSLRAKKIRYNRDTEDVDLWHASLWIGKVPILYVPWVNIPFKRRSGLLLPNLGQFNLRGVNQSGYFVQQPFYLDIADNIDNIFSFTWFQNRNILLTSSLRWLNTYGLSEFEIEYMPRDEVAKQAEPNNLNDYRRIYLASKQQLSPTLKLQLDWLNLSHRSYFNYFPTAIFQKPFSTSFERQLKIIQSYDQPRFDIKQTFSLTFSDIYSLKESSSDGYRKVPHFEYHASRSNPHSPLTVDLNVNATRHEAPSGQQLRNHDLYTMKTQLNRRFYSFNNFIPFYGNLSLVGFLNRYELAEQTINSEALPKNQNSFANYYSKLDLYTSFEVTPFFLKNSKTRSYFKAEINYIYSPPLSSNTDIFRTPINARDINNYQELKQAYRYSVDNFAGFSNRYIVSLEKIFSNPKWQLSWHLSKNFDIEEPSASPNLPAFSPAYEDTFATIKFKRKNWHSQLNGQWTNKGKLRSWSSEILFENSNQEIFRLAYNKKTNIVNNRTTTSSEYIGLGWNSYISSKWRVGLQADYLHNLDRLKRSNIFLSYDSCCWQLNILFEQEPSSIKSDRLNQTVYINILFKTLGNFGSLQNPSETIYRKTATIK